MGCATRFVPKEMVRYLGRRKWVRTVDATPERNKRCLDPRSPCPQSTKYDLTWKESPKTSNNQGKFQSRSIYHYDGGEWKVFEGKVRSTSIDALTIVSYNILSDLHDADKIETDKRLPIILEELKQSSANIIALQEVTPRSIEFISPI